MTQVGGATEALRNQHDLAALPVLLQILGRILRIWCKPSQMVNLKF